MAVKWRYKERLEDVRRWPWKVFCRAWRDLIIWAAEEAERKRQQDLEHEWSKLRGNGRSVGMGEGG